VTVQEARRAVPLKVPFRSARSEPGSIAAPTNRTSKLWIWFLAWEAVVALIYFPFGFPSGHPRILGVVPWMEWPGQVFAWAVLGLSAVVAIALGIRLYRPRTPLAWWFICAGVFLFISGDTCYKFWHQIIGTNIPFPSFIDAIYITMYPVLAAGLLLLARSRAPKGDRSSLLDSLIITVGLGLLSWIFLIGPNVRAHGGLLVRLTAAAYPLGDVLVLAMLAHLWSAGGLRNTAGRLLAIGTVGTLVADSVYGLANLHSGWNWSDGNPFDLGWILFYACWGAAALHPSMRELSESRLASPPRTSGARLVILGAVSLIAPIALLAETSAGTPVDARAVAAVAAVMFLLVVLRMAEVVWAHSQAVTREKVLRQKAGELVGAPSRDEICAATVKAVEELITDRFNVSCIALAIRNEAGTFRTMAAKGGRLDEVFDLGEFGPDVKAHLEAGIIVRSDRRGPSASGDDTERLLICPITSRDELSGVIMVHTSDELPIDLTNTLETLASQVSLALDRELLSEAFHSRRSEARFQSMVQNASDVILIARPDSTITYQTPSAKRILGYDPGSLEGLRLTSLVHPGDAEAAIAAYTGVALRADASFTGEWRFRNAEGLWRYFEVKANNLLDDPTVAGIVLTLRDVTERKGLEEELKHQAFHDALTGLANRALFRDRVEHALVRAARNQLSVAVLFLDLDDFKLVNDSLGHGAGDDLLVAVATRLTSVLSAGDTAARLGGDEFAILLEEISSAEDAGRVAEVVLNDLRRPFEVNNQSVSVRGSIGIALSSGSEDPAGLLQAADVAMYAAKGLGKNCFELYRASLQEAMSRRLEQTAELQKAVEESEFVLHYQPIVPLEGGHPKGVEALVRWNHPERGLLPPKDFIPLAEDTGLIVGIGRWVLQRACQDVASWQRRFPFEHPLTASVNISARHFQHDDLVADVSHALRLSGMDPSCLILEITESVLVYDAESVISRMLELKSLGVTFAIDDFGTGYSSLSYLKQFPIDILKVDKSFVDDVGRSDKASALTRAIVEIAQSLNLDTIAEGIEEAQQAVGLRALGCRFGQGYFFARPIAHDDMEAFLQSIATTGSTDQSRKEGRGVPV
jgi:diguanylate cyclase (GGDEF)-like protein/PAS domain S-box-containing protein